MWMFDQANLTGNEICFIGSGTAVLSTYTRVVCVGTRCYFFTWDSAVRSFWAGNEGGSFLENGGLYDTFSAFQREDTVNSITASAGWLDLYGVRQPGIRGLRRGRQLLCFIVSV